MNETVKMRKIGGKKPFFTSKEFVKIKNVPTPLSFSCQNFSRGNNFHPL
jgi:hypothetical protein